MLNVFGTTLAFSVVAQAAEVAEDADTIVVSIEVTEAVFDSSWKPINDVDGHPLAKIRSAASSSRLIALLGLTGILTLFMAAGSSSVIRSAENIHIGENAEAFSTFMAYGVVMSAPYLVNKFSSVVEMFGPIKK